MDHDKFCYERGLVLAYVGGHYPLPSWLDIQSQSSYRFCSPVFVLTANSRRLPRWFCSGLERMCDRAEILTQSAAAAAVGIISTMGSISSFLSPYLFAYLKTRTGSFTAPLWAVAAVGLTGTILTMSVPKRRELTQG